ncbi:hypothetical protein chiPu_0030793 [Chiloscyllium punctatum]|uniref:Rho-GAP domain-containing protein n=1 Tax=Chiloscyllium punctatum TaxID=137246 RepID=A0A401TVW5_CHIPU|nr:hypothetical protein [Chiloscyllium punctatum]
MVCWAGRGGERVRNAAPDLRPARSQSLPRADPSSRCPLPFAVSPPTDKLNLDDAEWEDIHVVSGALKMFFRELPEPLIPYNTFDNFIAAVSESPLRTGALREGQG